MMSGCATLEATNSGFFSLFVHEKQLKSEREKMGSEWESWYSVLEMRCIVRCTWQKGLMAVA